MAFSKHLSPTPTDLIDWLNGEGLLELDWDFPEDGDLFAAGLNSPAVIQAVAIAIEDFFGIELKPAELTRDNLATPQTMAAMIAARTA